MVITTVYIIRHGLTINAEQKRYIGHLDIPLSQEGEKQMERQASHLIHETNEIRLSTGAGNLLDSVYCSDLLRVTQSAEIIGRPFGLKPVIVPDFRECRFGHWEGMTFDEIMQTYSGELDDWAKDPLKFFPVGGESTMDVRSRVMPVFHDIIAKKRGKKIAIVAHGGVNRIILCELLGIPLQNIFRIEQDFSALNVCIFYDEVPVVKLMNYVVYSSQA